MHSTCISGIRGHFEVFRTKVPHVASIGVNFGLEKSTKRRLLCTKFHSHRCGVGCGARKLKIFFKFQHINALQVRIPRAILTKFLPFVDSFMFGVMYYNLSGVAQEVSELWGFKFMGVHCSTPKFSAPARGKTLCRL